MRWDLEVLFVVLETIVQKEETETLGKPFRKKRVRNRELHDGKGSNNVGLSSYWILQIDIRYIFTNFIILLSIVSDL